MGTPFTAPCDICEDDVTEIVVALPRLYDEEPAALRLSPVVRASLPAAPMMILAASSPPVRDMIEILGSMVPGSDPNLPLLQLSPISLPLSSLNLPALP